MKAAGLGAPVAHSLSPLLHRAAYAGLGLTDWTYDALDVEAEGAQGPPRRPRARSGGGFSVTMPCKQAAVDVADVGRAAAGAAARARTRWSGSTGGWRAENTDVSGIGMALQLAGGRPGSTAPAIIGAGGTAAAAAVGRSPRWGPRTSTVVVREPSRATDIERVLGRAPACRCRSTRIADAELDVPLVVGAPCRRAPHPALLPMPWRRAHGARRPVRPVADLARPADLPRRAAPSVGGLEVLFWQATGQVELMTGRQRAPDFAEMRAALDAALGAS